MSTSRSRRWAPPKEYFESPARPSGEPLAGPGDLEYFWPEDHPARQPAEFKNASTPRYGYANQDQYRVRWPAFGSLADIRVIDDPCDANSRARPFQLPDGRLHPVAASPVVYPTIASTKIATATLSAWPPWDEDCDDGCDSWKDEKYNSWVVAESDSERDEEVINCSCGKVYAYPLPVKIKSNPPGTALTIGDIILKLHPWFSEHKAEILRAEAWYNDLESLPKDALIYVRPEYHLCRLSLWWHDESKPWYTEDQWRKTAYSAQIQARKHDPGYPKGLSASQIERDHTRSAFYNYEDWDGKEIVFGVVTISDQ